MDSVYRLGVIHEKKEGKENDLQSRYKNREVKRHINV